MNFKDYESEILADAQEQIEGGNYDVDDILNAITGNYDGSYYCNLEQAKNAVMDMLDTDILREMQENLGVNSYERVVNRDWEGLDVEIRYYIASTYCMGRIYEMVDYEQNK